MTDLRRAIRVTLAIVLLALAFPRPIVGVSTSSADIIQLALPAPAGPYPAGVRSSFLTDPTRTDWETGAPRSLPIRVWYPAQHRRDGPTARYLSPVVQPFVEGGLGVSPGTFDIDTHAREAAVMRRHTRGVVLVSPGKGNPVAFQTGQVVDLASRGWIVVTMDHPRDAFIVEQPDGTTLTRSLDGLDEFAFEQRVLDVGIVLDHLADIVPEWNPYRPIGIYGHSMGGAAAAEAMRIYPILRAGVDLDGTPRGDVVVTGLDKPFGIMLSTIRTVEGFDDGILAWTDLIDAPHPIEQLDVYHNGFIDFVVFAPQAARVDPATAAVFESVFRTDASDVAHGLASLDAQRVFLARFMHRYL